MKYKKSIIISVSLIFLLNLTFVGFEMNTSRFDKHIKSFHEKAPLIAGDTPARLLWNLTWSNTYHDWCNDIAISQSGNIYAVGVSTTFGVGNRILLLKYNKTRGLEWEIIISSFDRGTGKGIALDAQENIYIVGRYLIPVEGSPGVSTSNMVLIKCNKFGELQWNKTWGGADSDVGYDIALDSHNNIFIVGSTCSYSQDSQDILLLKYSNHGSLLWDKIIDTGGEDEVDEAKNIIFDSEDNFYIIGRNLLGKFDHNGNPQWIKSIPVPATVTGISLDSMGCIYASGYDPVPNKNNQALLAKFNQTGDLEWFQRWGGPDSDRGYDVEIDSVDNIYFIWENRFSCYNTSGGLCWTNTWLGHANSAFYAIALDALGDIYLGGSGNNQDILLILKYDSTLEMKINSPLQNQYFGIEPPYYKISALGGLTNNTIWYEFEGNGNLYPIDNLEGIFNETEWSNIGERSVQITFYVMNSTGTLITSSVTINKDLTPPLSQILFTPISNTNEVSRSTLITINPSNMEIEAENVSKAKEKVDYVKSLPVVSDCEYVEEIK